MRQGPRRRARPPAALRAQSAVGQACARAPMRPANRVLLRWRSATELGMSNGPQEHHQRAGSPGQIQSGRLCHRLRRLPLRLRRPRSRAAAESARVLIVSYTTVGRPSVAYEFSASRAAPALSSPEPGFVICSPAGRWPAPRAATGCLRRSVEKVLVDAPGQRPAARPRKSQTGLALFLLKVLLTTATVPTVPARSGLNRPSTPRQRGRRGGTALGGSRLRRARVGRRAGRSGGALRAAMTDNTRRGHQQGSGSSHAPGRPHGGPPIEPPY